VSGAKPKSPADKERYSGATLPPRHLVRALVLGLALSAPAARAQSPVREVSLGVSSFAYSSFQRASPGFLALEGAYHQRLGAQGPWSALHLGGGLRTATPVSGANFPLEAFVQLRLSARLGIWEVMVGPELGVSGFARLFQFTLLPLQELRPPEDARLSPVYVAFDAAPLRLHLGRFMLSALELQLGTGVNAFGSVLRTQFGVLRLGVDL
jgi:hypothetical protein